MIALLFWAVLADEFPFLQVGLCALPRLMENNSPRMSQASLQNAAEKARMANAQGGVRKVTDRRIMLADMARGMMQIMVRQ